MLAGGQPRAAADPAGLAKQLRAAIAAVRDPASPPEMVDAAGKLQQAAFRALGDRPQWDAVVIGVLPSEYRGHVGHGVAAHREFASLGDDPPRTLPAWRIVRPLPASELRATYGAAQARFGVPWEVLAAVHLVETGSGRIVGLSTAGAQGPMQFIPETWESYGMGGDVWNTRDAVMGAANYLASNGADSDDLDGALFNYNNDTRYVRGVRHYAAMMAADERVFAGLRAWRVYYRTHRGDVVLPVGYESSRSIPVEQWLARHPR